MSRRELSRGNKGLWQRVEALWRSMLPRQATVTRATGGTVWVRFIDEGNDAPESQFPSTVAGVPIGSIGWVYPVGGGKGLFVVTGVPKTIRTPVISATASLSGSTAGNYFSPSHSHTVIGLTPGRLYTIDWFAEIQSTGTNRRRFNPRIRAIGSDEWIGTSLQQLADRNLEVVRSEGVFTAYPDSNGEITLTAGFGWAEGVVNAGWIRFKATLY